LQSLPGKYKQLSEVERLVIEEMEARQLLRR
jgi:hypothetical protein